MLRRADNSRQELNKLIRPLYPVLTPRPTTVPRQARGGIGDQLLDPTGYDQDEELISTPEGVRTDARWHDGSVRRPRRRKGL